MTPRERFVAFALVLYLLGVAVGALVNLVGSFDVPKPAQNGGTQAVTCASHLPICTIGGDARLLSQALLAGIVGSFLHAAQSLTSYIGNDTFKMSWSAWYVMRPWIGGVLGLVLAFAARAGLVGAGAAAGDAVNVNGMVALGLLGGWFSKTTTDKLQEVFGTLFKTDADKERTDKLKDDQPAISRVDPSPVPAAASEITVVGRAFLAGATVTINKQPVDAVVVSPTQLKVDLSKLAARPDGAASLVVKNTSGSKPESESFALTFSGTPPANA
jgi:IPT/TIG domain-containing protein